MKIKFFCPRWGSEKLSWNDFFLKIIDAGYNGIEYGIPNETTHAQLEQVWEGLDKHKLDVIPQHYGTYDADFATHYHSYAAWLNLVKPFKAIKIDSQTGKDFFTFEQNKQLVDLAVAHTKATGVPVYHETHRNKFPFAAHITKNYLSQIPYLKITLDVSHWVNVAESYLDDQAEALKIAIERTEHIHARVGYPEGPQITDPRAPEWAEALNKHLAWWDKIAQRKNAEGDSAVLTITPEFGPYPYMVHVPFTQQPIASQWDINKYMMDMLKDRYKVYVTP
jgi:sugar phosphate isomerase/epimerase